MLTVSEWRWQQRNSSNTQEDYQVVGWIMSTAASGLDLVTDLVLRLRVDQIDIATHYMLQSAALPEVGLRPQNRRALALLQVWLAESETTDEAWWDTFEQELKQQRFSLTR